MTVTIIGIIIAAAAIQIDKLTHFKYRAFPLAALLGVSTVLASLLVE